MSPYSGLASFVVAMVVVVGSFAYFLIRGGTDPVTMPVISGALGVVLSYFFAQHIGNGAATTALKTQIEANRATEAAASSVAAAVGVATLADTKGGGAAPGINHP